MLIRRLVQSLLLRTTGRILIDPARYDIAKKLETSSAGQTTFAPQAASTAYGLMGQYPSFEAAAADCTGYDAQNIARAVAARRQESIDAAKRCTDERLVDVIAAFGIIFAQLETRNVSVLDIGGGNGSFCDIVAHFFPTISLTWKVIETESMARACLSEAPHISWSSTIAGDPVDVTLISGALQYLPRPYDTLRDCGAMSRWLILQRTPVGEHACISRQVVPPEIFEGSFPHQSFARQQLLDALESIGSVEMSWQVEKDRYDYVSVSATSNGYIVRCRR